MMSLLDDNLFCLNTKQKPSSDLTVNLEIKQFLPTLGENGGPETRLEAL